MPLHLGVMALEGLIVVLLTCGKIPVALGHLPLELSPLFLELGHLLLELSLTQGQFFQDAFNTVQAIIAVRHV